MPVLFLTLLILDVAIFVASLYRGYYGHAWADVTCSIVYGLCDEPLWLGVAGAVFIVTAIVIDHFSA
jgi:hypothetical protein